MFEYLEKYNKLPSEIRNKVSSPQAMAVISELEAKYGLDLASVIMRVMIKEIDIDKLEDFFQSEYKISLESADQLAREIRERVLADLSDYLGIKPFQSTAAQIGINSLGREESLEKRDDFLFHPEDEEEIKKISQSFGGLNYSGDDYEEKAKQIISRLEIKFSSEALSERFKKILITHLKGIRDRIETKQVLMKPIESGGLAFDENSTDRALIVAQEVLKDKNVIAPIKPAKIKLPEDIQKKEDKKDFSGRQTLGDRDVAYDLSQFKKINPEIEIQPKKELSFAPSAAEDIDLKPEPALPITPSVKTKQLNDVKNEKVKKQILPQDLIELDTTHEIAPPSPTVIPKKELVKKDKDEIKIFSPKKEDFQSQTTIKIQEKEPEEEIKKPSVKFRNPMPTGGKKRMDDVKHVPRVMTPIDELKFMSFAVFRRSADTPGKAAEKIMDKIKLLESEKYVKKIEGVKAWRQSPLYRNYLKIGQISISENKPVGEIIAKLKEQGEDCLTEEEFEAIVGLNKKLRF